MHVGGLQLVKEDLVEVGDGTNETGLQRSPLVEGLKGAGDANVLVDPGVKMSSDITDSQAALRAHLLQSRIFARIFRLIVEPLADVNSPRPILNVVLVVCGVLGDVPDHANKRQLQGKRSYL